MREQSYWHGSNRATITMWSGGEQGTSPESKGQEPQGQCMARRTKPTDNEKTMIYWEGTHGTRGGPKALLQRPCTLIEQFLVQLVGDSLWRVLECWLPWWLFADGGFTQFTLDFVQGSDCSCSCLLSICCCLDPSWTDRTFSTVNVWSWRRLWNNWFRSRWCRKWNLCIIGRFEWSLWRHCDGRFSWGFGKPFA